MANTKISALTALNETPATSDLLPIVDVSDTTMAASGTTKRIQCTWFAMRTAAQTFTATQTFGPSGTGSNGIDINMPASTTSENIRFLYNGTLAGYFRARADVTGMSFQPRDLGNNTAGPWISINRNTNAGTEGPAPGSIIMVQANGTARAMWVDNSGLLRIHTAQPTGSTGSPTTNITAGSVIGDQTSMADAKEISDRPIDDLSLCFDRIHTGAKAVRRFTYKEGWGHIDQEYQGLVVDYAPSYGQDRDQDHPAGKALNQIQLFGDLTRAVAWLVDEVQAIRSIGSKLAGEPGDDLIGEDGAALVVG